LRVVSDDDSAALPLAPLPDAIGPYRIIGILGHGGMGVVYEAAETGAVRRRVALKVVHWGFTSRDVIARFEAERQALALMDHAGIAKVFHAGETPSGEPYFAMELVRGLSLTDYSDSRRLSMRERLELFIAVCHAVQHAHQKGVIHRDLKPSNILVGEQDGLPQPKIIDFGVAKALGQQLTESTVVTRAGVALGTAAYMSPEQAESSGLDVDTRTDIYSLGVILFELLVGRLPMDPRSEGVFVFLARLASRQTKAPVPSDLFTTLGAYQEAIAQARRTDPENLRRELRGDLDWIVMKALDPDRSRRYDTATSFAADVERHLANEPVSARPPSAGYRLQKFVRRHRVAVPVTLLAVVALAGSAAFALAGMIRATRAERLASQEAAAAREVTGFLVNLFKVSEPGAGRGNQITARELLDQGAQRAAVDLAQQPVLQGRIMHTIGTAYTALGLYDAARPQLEQALAARVRALGPRSPAVAETEAALGDAALAHGDFDLADAHLQRALAIRESTLGRDHPDVARVLTSMGALRVKQGRGAEAEALYARALAVDERPGGDSALLARDLLGLGMVKWQSKRYAEADPLLRRALVVQERTLGPGHPDFAAVLSNIGVLYWSAGRYADALPLYERARTIFERTLDPMHPRMASILNNLAETYWKLHRYQEAEPLFRRALAIKEARLAPTNPAIAVTLNGLGGLLRDEGRLAEAEAAYRRALAIRERALGPTNADVVETATALAALLRSSGRGAEAGALEGRLALRR
jgi:non-specific serine/threonine protein kinase/serine/threonine-protein kinase